MAWKIVKRRNQNYSRQAADNSDGRHFDRHDRQARPRPRLPRRATASTSLRVTRRGLGSLPRHPFLKQIDLRREGLLGNT